ncbi:hypothetical protein [Streptomyces ficellus]|uniref:Hydrogenase expression protein HypF n=1 Tax=Streptomyces ficellus TaxID=1977088 RepID=A0A6I6F658_9ACTN|nr:hypothetical protein [Streptomyces ficellus]QGV78431.1 hypothetical protein EIZ62_09390 [Streptomyces ficellus]
MRKGPRHAAPRKSLLAKIQAPAGKAMALAAMPTAVLVGLGMTPKLALADEKDIPFAPGPCVTRSDEPSESEKPEQPEKPSESESPAPKPSPSDSGKPAPDEEKQPEPGAGPSADETDEAEKDTTEPKTGVTKPPATPSPAPSDTPAPTPTETRNPLDPLGVGDAIKDIFDGPDEEEEPAATPSTTAPSAEAPAQPPADEPSTEPSTEPSSKPAEKPAAKDDATDKATDEADGAVDEAKEAIKDAADKAGAEVEELPEDAKGLDPTKDEDIPEGAKPRFPCPTADPEALAAAELEPGIPLLPDEPWRLESTKLTLRGLDYHGIVEVKTYGGKVKKVLKFTADEVDIKDLHQLTVHSDGHTGHVKSRPGSESTIRGGTVTMYTEELKGNLFGLIPITFSPDSPPPLNVPFAFFTDVNVKQAGQFGGNLTVPGLQNFVEG